MNASGVPVGDTTLLQRLKELDEKATPGPWGINAGYECYGIQSQAPGEPIVSPTWDTREEDARFICELRNALPAVVTLIEAARRHMIATKGLKVVHSLETCEICKAVAPFVGEATQ